MNVHSVVAGDINGSNRGRARYASVRRRVAAGASVIAVVASVFVALPAAHAAPSPNSGPAAGGTVVTVPVPGADSFIQTSAGQYHSLALDADGNLWSWGSDGYGQLGNGAATGDVTAPARVTTGTSYTAIAAGGTFSLALDAAGNLWSWGDDTYGQLGNGAPTGAVTAPARVTTGTTYTAIASGNFHSLALDAAGNLWSWGDDTYGKLGNGAATATVTAPAQITTGTSYTAIAAGGSFSLALDAAGNLWSWGSDLNGKLGNGAATGDVTAPARVTTGTTFTTITAGGQYSLALDAAGNLWSWGDDPDGQLGNGAATGDVDAPAQITTGTTYTAIDAATVHSLALDAGGNLWSWGSDSNGQLGNGAATGAVTAPAQITTGTTYTTITAEGQYSLALDAAGNLWSWGDDPDGQLGNGAATGNVTAPAQVTTGTSYTAIASGDSHSLALDAGGNIWSWGSDSNGQLGNGAATGNGTVPAQVTTGTSYTAIAAGRNHSLALDAGGNLWSWGDDSRGQQGNSNRVGFGANVDTPAQITTGTTFTTITAATDYSLALDAAGNFWSWGANTVGELGQGPDGFDAHVPVQVLTGTSYTDIDAGGDFALALDTSGNLWSWGNNRWGQLGNGSGDGMSLGTVYVPKRITTGTRFTAIAAGVDYALALDAAGNLWSWGSETTGQLGNGAATGMVRRPARVTSGASYTAIDAATTHSLALDAAGNLWSWGNDNAGKLGNGAATAATVTAPARVTTGITYTAIASGDSHSLALDAAGNFWSWGSDSHGRLGNGAGTADVHTLTRIDRTLITGIAFDGVFGTSLERVSETSARVTTPAGTAGPATITIAYSYDGVTKPTLTLSQRFSYVGAPGAPTSLTGTPGDGRVGLSWTAPASDGFSPVTDYRIDYSGDAGATWLTFSDGVTAGTSATVTGLANGTQYVFRVSAINTVGTGSPSATATATPVAATSGGGTPGVGTPGGGTPGGGTPGGGTLGDGTLGDGASGDGTLGDGTLGDRSSGAGTLGDGTLGDRSSGDGASGGGTLGDGTLGDRSSGDGALDVTEVGGMLAIGGLFLFLLLLLLFLLRRGRSPMSSGSRVGTTEGLGDVSG